MAKKLSKGEPDTGLFGRLAVALNLVTPEQLADSLDLQRRLAQGGRSLALGKIMLAKSYLSAFQIEEILKAQLRRAVRCASCGAEFAVRETAASPVRCPQCLRRLSDASVKAVLEEPEAGGERGEAGAGERKAPPEERPPPKEKPLPQERPLSKEKPLPAEKPLPEEEPLPQERPLPEEKAPVEKGAPPEEKAPGTEPTPELYESPPPTTPPLMESPLVPERAQPIAAPLMAGLALHVETKGGETREIDLEPGTRIVIGRAPGIDGIDLLDASLSRRHCVVAESDGLLTIEDLGSRNGTFVNGERVVRGALRAGDEVRIGDCRLLVRSTAGARPGLRRTTDVMRAEALCSLCGVVVSAEEITSGKAQRTTAGILCPRCLEVALVPGRILGGCRIIEMIGHGGMAEVYRAEQVTSGRIVALKTLIDPHGAGERAKGRFIQEARAGARLEHPNLVRIFDSGEESGIPYIVMEYIEGSDLAVLLDKRGFLPAAQALDIAMDIASVLAFAHSRGVVHRDVKPANIILDRVYGRARLVDLGVAKMMDQGDAEGLTRVGVGLGTLEYAAPEQIRSARDADARADIYSLAATLYRMVVGSRPFRASHELALAKAILFQQLSWPAEAAARLEKVCGKEFFRVVAKAMEKDREKRYASADEFREALTRLRESLG